MLIGLGYSLVPLHEACRAVAVAYLSGDECPRGRYVPQSSISRTEVLEAEIHQRKIKYRPGISCVDERVS